MTLEINKKYKLRILINNRDLTYDAEIISIDNINHEITFKDRFGVILTYSRSFIVGYEEFK